MPNSSPQNAVSDRSDAWICVALAAVACAPFLATLLFGYVYDDTGIILQNPVIQGWGALHEVWKYPYWTDSADNGGLYRPLLMLIFAVIWNGAHKFAIAFHAFALAMHVLATLLLWRLLRRATSRWAAAGAALWFAVHPVHVEAVANITNSSEVIVAVLALVLALVVAPSRGWRLAVAAVIYAAAMLTKESGAVIPALALIAVWAWREPRDGARKVDRREWAPVLIVWACLALAVAIVRHVVLGGLVSSGSIAAPGIDELSAPRRIWAMLSLGKRVLALLFWPGAQNPHYGPTVFASGGSALATVVVLAVCAVAAVRFRHRDSRPLAAVLWMSIAFLPASNLLVPTGQILAERTLYVSSVGAAMLIAWGLDLLVPLARRPRLAAVATVVLFGAICARGFVRAREYTLVWKDRLHLFTYMTVVDPRDYRGFQLLAVEWARRKQTDEAARLYEHAYELAPRDKILTADYATYLLEEHRPLEALTVARRLLEHPELRTHRRIVSLVLSSTFAAWGADSLLVAASRLDASDPSPISILFIGLAEEARGDTSAALAAYRKGLRRTPADGSLSNRLKVLDRELRSAGVNGR